MSPRISVLRSIASDRDAVGAVAASHLDHAFRSFVTGPMIERTPGYFRYITGEPHPFGNVATLRQGEDLAVADAAMEPLRSGSYPSAMIFPLGASESVRARVLAAGFADTTGMPAMAVDIEHLGKTSLPDGYAWSRVGAGASADAWNTAFAEGYGLPPAIARLFGPQADAGGAEATMQHFLISKAGRPVTTSILFLANGVAGIYCVATSPAERGRGLGAHATAEALRVAARLGYRVGVLQSSSDGHRVYLRLGFEDVARVTMFIRMPA